MGLTLTDAAARDQLTDYLRRVDQALERLPRDDASELRRDLMQHLADAFVAEPAGSESSRLTRAIHRLGDPEVFLPQACADHWIATGVHGFTPLKLTRGLLASIALGGKRALVGIAGSAVMIAAATLVLIGLLAPFLPMHVGMLEFPDGQRLLGLSTRQGVNELLGIWRAPLGLAAGLLLWWLLVRVLRRGQR